MRFVIFVLVIFFTVFAEQNKGTMKEYLGLNTEQEQKMKNLRSFCTTEESDCFVKLDELRKNLFVEAGKENPDETKINEIAKEIGNQHSLLSLCLAKQIQETKKILTKEQFDKFIDFRQNKSKDLNRNK
jgi:Spy/CpxP family protein refolding chaperone